MTAIAATDQNFPELTDKGITVIDFWATWCAPCKAMSPIIDELAGKYASGPVKVIKADLEATPMAARRANVRSVPTFMIMKDGVPVSTKVGQMQKAAFLDWVDSTVKAVA